MNLVLFLLCSGFVHFAAAANRFRRFYFNYRELSWNDSLEICTNHSMSFVTLYDEEDAYSLEYFYLDYTEHLEKKYWLGLQRIRENVTTWSNGDPYTFKTSNVTVTSEEQRCGVVKNNEYTDVGCDESFHFMCYKGNKYHLIDHLTKDWCRAQQYCRKHFDDLVSINDENQKKQVVEEGRNKTFWIGLLHDEWEWQDGSCSTYRKWKSETPGNCTSQGVQYFPQFQEHNCSSNASTLCSKGKGRIVIIRNESNWENALDYCLAHHSGLLRIEDEDDQKDVAEILESLRPIEQGRTHGPFWIGLRQSPVFGFWIWSDRTVTYSHWENDRTPEMPLSENCGVISTMTRSMTWRDENCLHLHPFLCEEEISFNN